MSFQFSLNSLTTVLSEHCTFHSSVHCTLVPLYPFQSTLEGETSQLPKEFLPLLLLLLVVTSVVHFNPAADFIFHGTLVKLIGGLFTGVPGLFTGVPGLYTGVPGLFTSVPGLFTVFPGLFTGVPNDASKDHLFLKNIKFYCNYRTVTCV